MIKLLAYYDVDKDKSNVVLSAVNKLNYIIDSIVSCGQSVDVISPSLSVGNKKLDGRYEKIKDGVTLKTFDSLPSGNAFKRFIRRKHVYAQLKKYLKENLSAEDTIIIYHSLGYYKLYKWLKEKLKVKIILEVEEIYSDVGKTRFVTRDKEVQSFSYADAYIFPTLLLDDVVNVNKKPLVIIHGTYCVEKECGQPFGDGKTHVVYAGTFDPRKGGVQAAAAAAEFLTGKYHVHILGFGSEEDKQNLLKTIEDVSKKTECTVTYDGLKSGEEYIRFIQSCDIGLSTQNPDAAFNATSFPSKILSYMANGLRVVSIRIPAIESSAIGDYMYYYDRQTPEAIAKAIMQVDLNDGYNGREIISKLDKKFTKEIAELISEVGK